MSATLIDTDVLMWFTRGPAGAAQRLHALPAWRISAVTDFGAVAGHADAGGGLRPAG